MYPVTWTGHTWRASLVFRAVGKGLLIALLTQQNIHPLSSLLISSRQGHGRFVNSNGQIIRVCSINEGESI